ncbi:MAG: hypothetical protein L6R37_000463 [Teloschistes peruensis]|nr:MAG: hypothetical protein L6R37_000463 [Teloschistes peruensis]
MAQNTVYQYGHAGLVNAMRSGDAAAMIDSTRSLCMNIPMLMLMMAPEMILGMNLREVSRALSFCTSWKKRLQNHSIPLRTAQESSTVMQMDEKVGLFHREFGISAGLLFFSWRPIQNTNTGINAMDIDRRVMVEASLMWERCPVMVLVDAVSAF